MVPLDFDEDSLIAVAELGHAEQDATSVADLHVEFRLRDPGIFGIQSILGLQRRSTAGADSLEGVS